MIHITQVCVCALFLAQALVQQLPDLPDRLQCPAAIPIPVLTLPTLPSCQPSYLYCSVKPPVAGVLLCPIPMQASLGYHASMGVTEWGLDLWEVGMGLVQAQCEHCCSYLLQGLHIGGVWKKKLENYLRISSHPPPPLSYSLCFSPIPLLSFSLLPFLPASLPSSLLPSLLHSPPPLSYLPPVSL